MSTDFAQFIAEHYREHLEEMLQAELLRTFTWQSIPIEKAAYVHPLDELRLLDRIKKEMPTLMWTAIDPDPTRTYVNSFMGVTIKTNANIPRNQVWLTDGTTLLIVEIPKEQDDEQPDNQPTP